MTVRAKGVTVAAPLSDNLKRVLDGKAFVTLATIQPDGSPQASPVWVKRDDGQLLMSTTIRRRKYQNLTRDPRATVVVIDHDQPYRYAQLRGTVELTRDGADELIDDLARKYTGKASYAEFNPAAAQDAPRVVLRFTPERVTGQGDLA